MLHNETMLTYEHNYHNIFVYQGDVKVRDMRAVDAVPMYSKYSHNDFIICSAIKFERGNNFSICSEERPCTAHSAYEREDVE